MNQTVDEILGHDMVSRTEPRSQRPMNAASTFGADRVPTRKSRRHEKWIRFLICEAFALIILAVALVSGVSGVFLQDTFTSIFRVITVAAAGAVVPIPVIFYGLPTSPRARRHR